VLNENVVLIAKPETRYLLEKLERLTAKNWLAYDASIF